MTFYHNETLRTLLLTDTAMSELSVDSAIRNYGRGVPFTVNSLSGNPGSEYAVWPVPGGWHVRHFRGTVKYRLADNGDLVSKFPGVFPTLSLGVR